MARISLKNSFTVEEAFDDFIFFKKTQGVTEQTIEYYSSSFKSLSRFLDTSNNISELSKRDLQKMVAEMREANLSTNTIACYIRAFRAFLSWARRQMCL